MELAAFNGHFQVLKLKKIRLDPKHDRAHKLINTACFGKNPDMLEYLLELGYPVNDQPNGGSSHIESLVSSMGWSSAMLWGDKRLIDNEKTRAQMKMLFLLVHRGARWIPEETRHLQYLRRSLLSLGPDYTAEFVWIMSEHNACGPAMLERLLQTPKMQAHLRNVYDSIDDLIEQMQARDADGKRPAG